MGDRPFIDFYGQRGIIPVHQDTRDLAGHYRRREILYRHLGLTGHNVTGKRVIEFGPGTGDNARYTASLGPALYRLVDGNPASLAALRDKVAAGDLPAKVEIVAADITQYRDEAGYDLVLCEGVVPGQKDPAAFLRHIAGFAAPGGLLVITTVGAVSYLAEICRRLLLPFFRARHPDDEEALVTALRDFFAPGLATLPGMSRDHRDWVLDNILYDWTAHGLFPLEQAIAALPPGYEVMATSPRILQDWRWYKQAATESQDANRVAAESAALWTPYLLDYRTGPEAGRPLPEASGLQDLCDSLLARHSAYLASEDPAELDRFLAELTQVAGLIADSLPATARAIADYKTGVAGLAQGDLESDFGSFHGWFGRGMQYLCAYRREDLGRDGPRS